MHASSFEPFTVLYVDNNPDDLSLMQLAVTRSRAAFQLQCFMEIRSAQQYLLGANPFTNRSAYPSPILVLVDYTLDGEKGTQLISWIRKDQQFEGLTVILLSDSQADNRIEEAYAVGANLCLRKPPTFEEMKSFVECLTECITTSPAHYEKLTQLPLYHRPSQPNQFSRNDNAGPRRNEVA